MPDFPERLINRIKAKKSYVVCGLDPVFEKLPDLLKKHSKIIAIEKFSRDIINVVAPYAVAIKLQYACYERYGWEGIRVFENLCKMIKAKGVICIADVKRGDIFESSKVYAEAYFDRYQVDAVTINPYFGSDCIRPFVEFANRKGAGVFIVVKTSNLSSYELQDIPAKGVEYYIHVARLCEKWARGYVGKSRYSLVGAVVGATFPEAAIKIRKILKNCFLLVPGYGAQGATANDIKNYFNDDRLGAIINASRTIIYAFLNPQYKHERWQKSVEMSIKHMVKEINSVIK
jgi:orotidine-5'-phosphate decarboxylase